MNISKNPRVLFFNTFISLIFFLLLLCLAFPRRAFASNQLFTFQSIDTMKISRDRARKGFLESGYLQQLKEIKNLGAQYVAIDTPYDEEFYPYLKQWVDAAHSLGLHVWFRGNFSGWEGWFNYPQTLTRQDHLQKTQSFILTHPDLFTNGDSFTPCPECEYGGSGNPLVTGDVIGYRKFMVDEYRIMQDAFKKIHKEVYSNWFSMNPDVAKGVLDEETVLQIGNLIVLDDYVRNANELQLHLEYFNKRFPQAKLFLGEFGAPIPDINGSMTEEQQAHFVDSIMNTLYKNKNVIGFNYWDEFDGSSALFNPDTSKRLVTSVIAKYFNPYQIYGTVIDAFGKPIANTIVRSKESGRLTVTDENGAYSLAALSGRTTLITMNTEYAQTMKVVYNVQHDMNNVNIILQPAHPSFLYQLKVLLYKYVSFFYR